MLSGVSAWFCGFFGADQVALFEGLASLLPFFLDVLHRVHSLRQLRFLFLNFASDKCSHPLVQRRRFLLIQCFLPFFFFLQLQYSSLVLSLPQLSSSKSCTSVLFILYSIIFITLFQQGFPLQEHLRIYFIATKLKTGEF